jgi:lipid-binding SYLF domain-containing protein
MDAYYGHDVSTHRVLSGEVEMPASAHKFIDAVRESKAQAKAAN